MNGTRQVVSSFLASFTQHNDIEIDSCCCGQIRSGVY